MLNQEDLDTEYYDDMYQDNDVDFYNDDDSSNEDDSSHDSDELQLKKSRFRSEINKYRFFSGECSLYEFNRTPITFRLFKDSTDYKGIVMKELDKTHFIFLLEEPDSKTKRMKKIDITDISVYF